MKLSELYFLRYILKNNHIAFFISQLNKNVMSTVTKLQNELILDEYSLLANLIDRKESQANNVHLEWLMPIPSMTQPQSGQQLSRMRFSRTKKP